MFIETRFNCIPVTHDQHEPIPGGHLRAACQEDRPNSVLIQQPVLDRVVSNALVAADRDPTGIANERQPFGVRGLRLNQWASGMSGMHEVFPDPGERLADAE